MLVVDKLFEFIAQLYNQFDIICCLFGQPSSYRRFVSLLRENKIYLIWKYNIKLRFD